MLEQFYGQNLNRSSKRICTKKRKMINEKQKQYNFVAEEQKITKDG